MDTMHPTILSVSPMNNEKDVSKDIQTTNERVTVVFSEDMDPSTINTNTFFVMQRTTPESGWYTSRVIDGTIQLKNADPNQVLKLVRKKHDSLKINIQGNSPGHATVEHWIEEARDHPMRETAEIA